MYIIWHDMLYASVIRSLSWKHFAKQQALSMAGNLCGRDEGLPPGIAVCLEALNMSKRKTFRSHSSGQFWYCDVLNFVNTCWFNKTLSFLEGHIVQHAFCLGKKKCLEMERYLPYLHSNMTTTLSPSLWWILCCCLFVLCRGYSVTWFMF